MRKAFFVAVAAAVLALPAPALAKQVSKLQVCGLSDCASTTDRGLLMRIGEGTNGSNRSDAPALQPYYRLVYTVTALPGESFGDGKNSFTFTNAYIPGARLVSGTDESDRPVWFPVSAEFAAELKTLAANVAPVPRPRIVGVTIGDKLATRPDTYARLFTLAPDKRSSYVDAADWVPVTLRTSRPSPWTSHGPVLQFSPKTGVIDRGSYYYALPGSIAAEVSSGKALTAPADSFPWDYVLFAALGVLFVAALGATLARRGHRVLPGGQPKPTIA